MRPGWLETKGTLGPCPCCRASMGRQGFLERTLEGIGRFFREGIFSQEYASRAGLLQGLDPRVKVVTAVLWLVMVSVLRAPLSLLAFYLISVVLAVLSKIPMRYFLFRVWFFIPLFSAMMALPAVLNLFVPGRALVVLVELGDRVSVGPFSLPDTISITHEGVFAATVFVLRVAASVSWVVLLLLTTRWSHLLKALRVFRIPQFFVFMLGMTYRYIHLLVGLIEQVHLAKKSRTLGRASSRMERGWVASQIALTLRRSVRMSDEVYDAMMSRGFSGELKIVDTFYLKGLDYLWLAGFVSLVVMVAVF